MLVINLKCTASPTWLLLAVVRNPEGRRGILEASFSLQQAVIYLGGSDHSAPLPTSGTVGLGVAKQFSLDLGQNTPGSSPTSSLLGLFRRKLHFLEIRDICYLSSHHRPTERDALLTIEQRRRARELTQGYPRKCSRTSSCCLSLASLDAFPLPRLSHQTPLLCLLLRRSHLFVSRTL